MTGRLLLATALTSAVIACGDRAIPEGTGAEAPGDGTGPDGAGGAAADTAGVLVGEIADTEPVAYQIFDEIVEPAAPRRVTLHMLVSTEANRDQLRATLSEALLSAADQDSAAVAIRAIGYRPRQVGPQEAEMEPYVWAEWLPNEGWYGATTTSREGLHRVYFYHPVAPQW